MKEVPIKVCLTWGMSYDGVQVDLTGGPAASER
jgi:hypothetical protein